MYALSHSLSSLSRTLAPSPVTAYQWLKPLLLLVAALPPRVRVISLMVQRCLLLDACAVVDGRRTFWFSSLGELIWNCNAVEP